MIIDQKEVDRMCNLSEGVWEKGIAAGMAKGVIEGKLNQLVHIFETLMSKGMKFDEVVNLLDITLDNVTEIKKRLNISGNA